MRSIGPAVTREQSPAFLRNSNGRLDFPGPTQEASRIPRRNSRMPPQLEKKHVVPRHRMMKPFPATAFQEKSHVRNWRSKRYLAPLMRPHQVPRHPGLPGEEHRGFPAPLPLSPFYPPDLDKEGRLPCFVWKGFPTFGSHLRMRPVSRRHFRRGLVGASTLRSTPKKIHTFRKKNCFLPSGVRK